MSSFGVTLEGFVQKTLEEILEEVEEAERTLLGAGIDTQADSVLGQINGVIGDKVAELWEVAASVYRARQPDSASGEPLDNVGAITGAIRLGALASTATLSVNLGAGKTLAAGSIASIGATGARWVTQASVTNAAATAATVSVAVKSEDVAPIVGNAFALDTIAVPVSGWSAKASKNTLNSEPFYLIDAQTLLVEIDEGALQTVTFSTGDFVSIAAATALEVADAITAALSNAVSIPATGTVRLTSDLEGTGSSVRITGGTAAESLGFTREKAKGFNPDTSAQLLNTLSETYALANSETLFVKTDRGGVQTVTFATGDFVAIGAATAIEVAESITAQITGGVAYEVGGKVQIESSTGGTNSFIEVTGGTANAVLGFVEDSEQAGVSGDATLGRTVESDEDYRLRREEILRVIGAATVEAIRAAIRAITDPDVTQAYVIENDTDSVDGFGRPAHSFEAIVVGGDDTPVAQAIFDTKPVGTATYRVPGADGRTVAITDSQGISHDINYSRANDIREYITIDITADQDTFGGGVQAVGEQQVRDALKAYGVSLQIGDDIIIMQFACAALEVAGVTDVTATKIEDVTPPTNTANIAIGPRDYATFASSDIVVVTTFA